MERRGRRRESMRMQPTSWHAPHAHRALRAVTPAEREWVTISDTIGVIAALVGAVLLLGVLPFDI